MVSAYTCVLVGAMGLHCSSYVASPASPVQSDSGIYTQSVKSDCLAGGSNPSGPTGPLCDAVKANCWMTAAPTTNVLFRCVPSYNVTNTLNTICIYPNSNIPATGECTVV